MYYDGPFSPGGAHADAGCMWRIQVTPDGQ